MIAKHLLVTFKAEDKTKKKINSTLRFLKVMVLKCQVQKVFIAINKKGRKRCT